MPNDKELSDFVSSEHFNQDKQIFENRRPELIEAMSKRIDMGTMVDFFLNDTPHRVPEEPLPEMKPVDIKRFLEPTDSVRFVWLGHSSIMMNVQNRILLFDPIFSKAAAPINFMVERFQPPVIRLEDLPEIDWISKKIHSSLPKQYRNWRKASSFSDDVHLGIWVAWLIWLRTPDLVAQGVGAVARTGILGMILSVCILLGLIIASGLTVVIARAIIGVIGPIPRTLGSLSVGIRPRAWGLARAKLGYWILNSQLVGPIFGNIIIRIINSYLN